MNTLERITHITPAFDKRSPDPSKNYGIHGCELRMVLKGELGAVQFVLFTNWQLPHVTKENMERPLRDSIGVKVLFLPLPADLGYHSPKPMYDEQPKMAKCDYVEGGCYYDGSGLQAEEVYEILLTKGSDGVWEFLEDYYNRRFKEKEEA